MPPTSPTRTGRGGVEERAAAGSAPAAAAAGPAGRDDDEGGVVEGATRTGRGGCDDEVIGKGNNRGAEPLEAPLEVGDRPDDMRGGSRRADTIIQPISRLVTRENARWLEILFLPSLFRVTGYGRG